MTFSHLPDVLINDLPAKKDQRLRKSVPSGDKSWDARIHRVHVKSDNGEICFMLRQQGIFLEARCSPQYSEPETLDIARQLTAESLVRILDWTNDEQQYANTNGIPIKKRLEICRLVLLSQAKPGVATPWLSHNAPGDNAVPLDRSSKFLNRRLDNRLLDVRVAATASIFKISSGVHELAVAHLKESNYLFVPTPTLIHYDFPGEEGTQFELPYFDKSAWLTQTGEVHLGMALSADLERVYDIHTVFRREEGIDARHLTEFTMIEAVLALKRDWIEILDFAEDLLVSVIRSLQTHEKYRSSTQSAQLLYPSAGDFRLGLTSEGTLIRLKFTEAKKILRESIGMESNADEDLTNEEEAALGRYLASDESHLGPPTDIFVVTCFPKHLRSFSIRPTQENHNESSSFDIIMRGQEIVTGCQLLHGHEELRSAMISREHAIDPDCPAWRPYVEAHEIAMPPWGGFGLGLNRFVQGFLGLTDIRETVLFPRDSARLRP